MMFIFITALFASLQLTLATTDMNIHEMIFVANELTGKECKMLAEALHRKTFQLWTPVTGNHEPNKTCLYLLLKWDRTEGRSKTFVDLAIRLRQIGRPDVANNLSKTVYHEKADALKRKFLDDPFKTMIATESFLLDNARKRKDFFPVEESNSGKFWEIFWVVTGLLSFLLILTIGCRMFCPGFCGHMWNKHGPEIFVEPCDLCCSECRRCCNRFGRHYTKYVIGFTANKISTDQRSLLSENV